MISLEDAQARVLARVSVLEPVEREVREALGCVLAADEFAAEAIPPFSNTAVDGYAVRAQDVAGAPCELRVVGEVRAGEWPTTPVEPGEAIRIMTGAPIPSGADAVVMVEDTTATERTVLVRRAVRSGYSIRPAGDDVTPGDLVLRAGTVLRPAHLGLLAELGRRHVGVHRRLRVAVVATGDELVSDGSPLAPGQIRESNTELLAGLLAEARCEAIDYGVVVDEAEALRSTLRDAIGTCDAVLTSGGVSMGDYDLVKVILAELGEMEWMQVAIRPAKPFAIGVLPSSNGRAVPVFGLPGNPVSSMVSFELLARPALMTMMGHHEIHRPVIAAIADERIGRDASDERVNFVRVLARADGDGRVHVRATGAQGSHQLANSADANGLARIASGAVAPGGEIPVTLIAVGPGALS